MPAPVLDCEYNNQAMFEMTPMMEEVLDQPRALADVRKYYTSPGAIPFSTLRRVVTHWPPTVVFTGMGSSLFAAYPAQAFLTSVGIRALVWETAELLHHHLRILKTDTLLVIVSQSGETVEVTRLLKHLPKRVGVLGVVNVESSTLGRRANVLLPMPGSGYRGRRASAGASEGSDRRHRRILRPPALPLADVERRGPFHGLSRRADV